MAHVSNGSSDKGVDIAVKRLTQIGNETDVAKFYDKENSTLEVMRSLKKDHLIRAIATYKKGNDRYFLFPWAKGGNLQDMLEKDERKLDKDLINWIVCQIVGLSEGIAALHANNIRHGDIKPSNILCDGPDLGASNKSILLIADVGLAKKHEEYTRYRPKITTTRHGSITYEPPEVSPKKELGRLSRKYDVWSLGCVFLELIIWAVYGTNGIKTFHKELNKNATPQFWKDRKVHSGEKVHSIVKKRFKDLKKDLKNLPALAHLVEFIEEKLLKVSVDERPYSTAVYDKLKTIKQDIDNIPEDRFNAELTKLVPKRETPAPAESTNAGTNLATQYRSSRLEDTWRILPENGWVKTLRSQRDWSSPALARHISKSCQFYQIFESELLSSDLDVSISQLRFDSRKCPLCRFLLLCLKRTSLKLEESMKLLLDEKSHALRISSDGTLIASIYSDPASKLKSSYAQVGRPLLPKYPGKQRILMKNWVDECNKTHECMWHKTSAYMPTRVIDVGKGSLRLVETRNKIMNDYIALSHCWGILTKEERFCTYSNNIEALKRSIPYDSLPKSFQHAVDVTRLLGVQYLWIDSLCIIQEDKQDWELEAAKMEDIFSSAYCTIAACSAASSLDGFLGKRNSKISFKLQTSRGPRYLIEPIDNFQEDVEQSVLSKRGWVLQERALSRRTIYFTSNQMYWECGEGIFCETLATLHNSVSQFLSDSDFPNYALSHYKNDRIQLTQHLYQLYSTLHLTNVTDRPKAILGLQNRLARTFQSRADYGVIWIYLERTLLWQAESPRTMSRISYQECSRVPSWSWMAYTGAIKYMNIPFQQVHWTQNIRSPFGAKDHDSGQDSTENHNAEWDSHLHAAASELLIDKKQLLDMAIIDSEDSMSNLKDWKCIVVGKNKETVINYVLLIRPQLCTSKIYERVGVAALSDTDISPKTESIILI